jgi:hypothetical protein
VSGNGNIARPRTSPARTPWTVITMPPDPFDAALSALHTHVDNLGPWLAIWAARTEPDAHARRCANGAMDAIDGALAALHRIRGELVGQVRAADDATAARVDELLARTRDGPPVPHEDPEGRRPKPQTTSSRSKASADGIVGEAGVSGLTPGEVSP